MSSAELPEASGRDRTAAPVLDQWGRIEGRLPSVVEARAAFEALGNDATTDAGMDAYLALQQAEHHAEVAEQQDAVRRWVSDSRREHDDDVALRAELVEEAKRTGQVAHEMTLQTSGGESWWTDEAVVARDNLRELDRQLDDEAASGPTAAHWPPRPNEVTQGRPALIGDLVPGPETETPEVEDEEPEP